ncbi:MAG: pantetheine-phosphate adenylyltransferase [Candidatus Omnitrophica bacterium]|nr:pantetheine-phosphate adenylyltransferase [Candidatus Omnitrophota bacterium]
MSRAVYPGSFDPVTYGHLDIVARALRIFDEIIVAVAHNEEKHPVFTVPERVEMLKEATREMAGVTVDDFDGLAVAYVRQKKAHVLIRGLRAVSDFEYEFQMALTNRQFDKEVETLFMMPSQEYSFLSSKLIKEAAALRGDVSSFVPPFVAKLLTQKLVRS